MASVIAPSLTITRHRTHMADETLTLTRYIILSLLRPNVDCPSELAWKFRALVSNVRDEKKLLLSGSCHQISLTNDNAQATFFAIADEVFEDAINWGRIVTFYIRPSSRTICSGFYIFFANKYEVYILD